MGFGEEYQGMSEREILVELAIKIDNIRCPSPRCNDHDRAINNLDDRLRLVEQVAQMQKEKKENTYVVWGLFISAVAGWGGLVIALVAYFER